ncbi:uncharacterized protein LOC106169823 [Lingula anatina]|uniref:Uncharacterized protein LOC106169823 n=1 Tax=Lingula anatina TaxID=7574 RepID=A0A1S3J3Q8_LINAN|nr:uncharacterized protein LOC106169823 [Lingula anatina]|eukprot:XP_013404901.1 uncharacterized protein LOC106169823 [Lingula anatina]
MNEILMKHVLRHLGEQFEYPVSSKSLEKDGASIKCMYTDQVFKPNAATLVRRTVKIDGGRVTLDGGMHSPVVVHQNYPAWRELLGTPELPSLERAIRYIWLWGRHFFSGQ